MLEMSFLRHKAFRKYIITFATCKFKYHCYPILAMVFRFLYVAIVQFIS